MIMPSAGPEEFFTDDHRVCDAAWSEIEAAIGAGEDERAHKLWTDFEEKMRRHFAMEEEVLFPEFEAVTGMAGGPTQIMRMEHVQMRGVLDQMARAAADRDYQLLNDHGDTLLMLIQQHNVKEEGVLYPMCGDVLKDRWEPIAKKLDNYVSRA